MNTVTLLLEDQIEKDLTYVITHKHRHLKLVVPPIIYAYLTKGWSWKTKIANWRRKLNQKIILEQGSNYHLTEYRFFDPLDEAIKL